MIMYEDMDTHGFLSLIMKESVCEEKKDKE